MVWQLPTFRAIRQEHIQLVLVRYGNQQVGVPDTSLYLGLIAGAVAQHCLNVHGVDGIVQALLIGVNECNGVIFLTKLLCQGQANLSTANNDDIHRFPLFSSRSQRARQYIN